MITEQGAVIATQVNQATVRLSKQTGCAGCQQKTCGVNSVARLMTVPTVELLVENAVQAKVGDMVQVGMPEAQILTLSLLLYLMPLLGMFAGLALGHFLAVHELWQAGLALSGLVSGFFLPRRFEPTVQPVILLILSSH